MRQALILGKFLPPHLGHKYLIDFAINYPDVDYVDVVVGTQPGEPIEGRYRAAALMDHYSGNQITNVVIHHLHKTMPQYPEDATDFWDQWKAALQPYIRSDWMNGRKDSSIDLLIFASEPYGEKLAEVMGGRFIPVNIDRTIVPTSGTAVRGATDSNWDLILPEMRKFLAKRVTIFGSDSVGKTTISRLVADWYNGIWLPEYARGYCDVKGTDIDNDKLLDIAAGQYAQDCAILNSPPKRWIIRDTDLITTVGYTEMMADKAELPEHYMRKLWQAASDTISDFYVVLDTDIAFTPDPMRYGGDQRQSTTKFWTDILDREKVPYKVVGGQGVEERMYNVIKEIDEYFWDQALT